MTTIRAHFDGSVFVPDEPVSIPANSPVRLMLVPPSDEQHPLLDLLRATEGVGEDGEWPADGASQHDHYLYGTPKKPT